jgi:hypothetical protein
MVDTYALGAYVARRVGSSPTLGTKILQFDLDNNLINEFNSIREASEKTGIDRKSISNCSKGIKSYNTTGGYKFKRKENI